MRLKIKVIEIDGRSITKVLIKGDANVLSNLSTIVSISELHKKLIEHVASLMSEQIKRLK